MILSSAPALPPGPRALIEIQDPLQAALLAAGLLLLSACFALLRASLSLARVQRVLTRIGSPAARARMQRMLSRADGLITSAAILKVSCDLLFLSMLIAWTPREGGGQSWPRVLVVLAFAVPVILLVTEMIPAALARRHGERYLVHVLPLFRWVELPLRALVAALELSRRAIVRMMGLPEETRSERQIVEDLREVIQDSGPRDDLDPTERELIENVMEIRDVAVAAIMTPRTEIEGVEVGEGLPGIVRCAAQNGHSRIPVYEGSLDSIIGFVPTHAVVQVLATGELDQADLRDFLRPVYFVPETKRISELLIEFRRERQKLAIVLDEYGGTAGLVTMSDVLEEIVGEIQDEFEAESGEAFQLVEPGVASIDASLHVSEVNELFELAIPEEEDYETLAGFVLAELGHFPQRGESFVHEGVEYEIAEATDRRVVRVRAKKPVHQLSP